MTTNTTSRSQSATKFGAGSNVVVGRTESGICPVTALLDYVSIRGDHPGPFFVLETATPITKPWFVAQLRGILAAVGLPQGQFAGHSSRIGAATTAALVGIEDSTIQALGRWQSAAFLQYIWTPKSQLAAMSRTVKDTGQHLQPGHHQAAVSPMLGHRPQPVTVVMCVLGDSCVVDVVHTVCIYQ